MTYVLTGPSALFKEQIEALIRENHFLEEERFTFDLEEISLFSLLEDVNTISFLSPKKVVIAKNAFFLGTEVKRKMAEDEVDAFLTYLDHQNEDVLLILTVEKLDERKKKLLKTIREKTKVIALSFNLEKQIKTNFAGYTITKDAINTLLLAVKGEESRLVLECEKLKLYKWDEKKIEKKDVEEMVRFALPDKDETVFAFSRQLAEKNKKEAYKTYQLLTEMGVDALSLMGLLESQYRALYQVKVLSQKGFQKNAIADALSMHPFRVQKTQELMRLYSKKAIQSFLLLLQKLDYQMKSGKIDVNLLIDLLIMGV